MGCGMSQEKFEEDYTSTMCDRSLECAPEAAELLEWADASDCIAFFNDQEGLEEVECTYNASFAQKCIDETKAMSCDDYISGNFPESCNSTCPE